MDNWKEVIKRDWLILIVFLAAIVLCLFVYNEIDRMLDDCNEFWANECGYNVSGVGGIDINGSPVTWQDHGHSDTIGAGLNIPMQGDV